MNLNLSRTKKGWLNESNFTMFLNLKWNKFQVWDIVNNSEKPERQVWLERLFHLLLRGKKKKAAAT